MIPHNLSQTHHRHHNLYHHDTSSAHIHPHQKAQEQHELQRQLILIELMEDYNPLDFIDLTISFDELFKGVGGFFGGTLQTVDDLDVMA